MANLAVNRKASFNYELLDRFEGGLALTGGEVKSSKKGSVDMKGSYLSVEREELWIKNMHIAKYAPAGPQPDYDPLRPRKVLVHKKELKQLQSKSQSDGLTIVPIRVYTKGDLVKIEFALARGKKSYEKRDSIKKRDVQRHMKEEMKKTRFGS
jgi:SsrA-binding protein